MHLSHLLHSTQHMPTRTDQKQQQLVYIPRATARGTKKKKKTSLNDFIDINIKCIHFELSIKIVLLVVFYKKYIGCHSNERYTMSKKRRRKKTLKNKMFVSVCVLIGQIRFNWIGRWLSVLARAHLRGTCYSDTSAALCRCA